MSRQPRDLPLLACDSVALNLREVRQTQHRAPMRPQPLVDERGFWYPRPPKDAFDPASAPKRAKHYSSLKHWLKGAALDHAPWQPGDSLYVRETWGLCAYLDGADWFRDSVVGRSEDDIRERWRVEYRCEWGPNQESCFWRPSILMPKWAARTWLKVTRVWAERMQDISEEDARAEGVERCGGFMGAHGWMNYGRDGASCDTARDSFASLWDSLYHGSWQRNDWLWCCQLELDRERSGVGP